MSDPVTQCKRCGLFGGHSVDCFGKADGVLHVEATKADGNKPRLDLVSEPALIGLAKVLEKVLRQALAQVKTQEECHEPV